MQRLKPTTIIALDPHAAAFCEVVRQHLERGYGARGSLIQLHALVSEAGGLRFERDLTRVADPSFDLGGESEGGAAAARAAEESFEAQSPALEKALADMLRVGRSFKEIQAAKESGYEIAAERVIYVVLSAADPAACGTVSALAKLIKWTLLKQFAGEVYTLHAVLLMPDLFTRQADSDYASAYALLKRLEALAAGGVNLGPHQKVPPFNTYWLMDGLNARAVALGPLAENVDGYADAFAGFLAAEPERSGALPALRARGKVPAYNSFGYGELYLPGEVAVTRLSSALARDLIRHAFTAGGEDRGTERRALLLAAKRFVQGKAYFDTLAGTDRRRGALIWQQFRPSARFDEDPHDYVHALKREHAEFERKQMLEMRAALGEQREQVEAELLALLDEEVDRRADAAPDGLYDALEFLEIMCEPYVALERDLLGDEPQNLVTEFRAAKAQLDEQLGVGAGESAARALLQEAQDLRTHLRSLDRDLRLLPAPAEAADAPEPFAAQTARADASAGDGDGAGADGAAGDDDGDAPVESGRELLQREIEIAADRLRETSEKYRRALVFEEHAADRARPEARRGIFKQREEAVVRAGEELVAVDAKLRAARNTQEDLEQQRKQFIRRHGSYLLAILLFAYGVPLALALAEVELAQMLVSYLWSNLWNTVLGTVAFVVVYAAYAAQLYLRTIHGQLTEARELVNRLTIERSGAASNLQRAHDAELRLDYQLDAQNQRVELFDRLIAAARVKARELKKRINELKALGDEFDRDWAAAAPETSMMRRPLLTVEDIDAYYARAVPGADVVSAPFLRDEVSRARARAVPLTEFRERLVRYARRRFERLLDMSIEDALLRETDLVPPNTALRRLQELNDAAEPLIRLHSTDVGTDAFAQRDVTLWAGANESDAILRLYRRICPEVTVRPSLKERSLHVLTRWLYFPAYFLASIEHYRACYERDPQRDAAEFDDIVPVDAEMKRAYETLLLGIALGVVERRPGGSYGFADGGEALGADRAQLARDLATGFSFQKHYAELSARLKGRTADRQAVRLRLLDLLGAGDDFDDAEREMLNALAQKYHPLY